MLDGNMMFQTIWNAALQIGAGYLGGYLTGGHRAGLAGVATTLVTGQLALHQRAPKDK